VTSPGSGSHLTDAQRRQPRPGTGTGYRYRRGYFYPSRPYYYSYYSPFYFPYYAYGWPYDGMHVSAFYGSPYGYDGYGSYPYDRNGDTGALRLLVDPEETRVYVDGDYAGIADDFSGLSQRLHISPGRHEITLELEGYRAHRVRVYVGAGQTLRIEYTMPKGTGPETFEDLSGEVEDRYSQSPNRYESEQSTNRRDDRGRVRLAPVVRPDDASVYVDGEFKGAARQVHSLELPPGRHRIEVVRPGFRTEERDVDVDRDSGAGSELVIELQRL